MPRKILLLAILASSVLFLISAAAPSQASAANCSSNSTYTTWQAEGNYLRFHSQLYNCTGVNGVEFKQYQNDSDLGFTGWRDFSNGFNYPAPSPLNPQLYGLYYTASSYGFTWYRTPWCGGLTHTVRTQFIYRIRNSNGNTWGSWYYRTSPNHAIVC